ncbi:MAG: GNAT family N-acetyltransferase [Candidatus Shapirobacteria bacterium]|nr:GNAT family N-acetyltransferase [Candidatus Shapirobacteria bacterium]MDD3003216.1 GNAT family N-acetyltransferase [Candidatus Shapirobacteria bacterium]MDD4383205.1 GNAT family N-acetyltransferase [Candidatus Shapirobacteria bacterium]
MIKYKFWSDYKHSPSDVKSINYLLALLTQNPDKITTTRLNEICKNSHILLALDKNNKIIGMATLALVNIPVGKSGRIEDVVVDDKFRGQGIGTTLINKLITKAKTLHLKKIDLTSNPKRVEANKLYLKLNFFKYETNVYRMKFEK